MSKLAERLADQGARKARKLYQRLETKLLVAEGRKAIKRKAELTGQVAKKAAKAGLTAAAVVATTVVAREIKKRRVRG